MRIVPLAETANLSRTFDPMGRLTGLGRGTAPQATTGVYVIDSKGSRLVGQVK